VNDLQDAARLRHGGLGLSFEPIELGPVVAEAVELAQLMAQAQGQTIGFSQSETPVRVNGDAQRIEQVVLNLATNAISYAAGTDRIDVRVQAAGDHAIIEVQDYGPGIPEEFVPRLFSQFYRGRAEGTGGGLGLGLFISKEIVTAHGGAIDVRSAPGAGATFIVRLPLLKK